MSDEGAHRVRRRRDAACGVYVHVPFCASICPYCDFAVTAKRDIPHKAYAEAVIEEFDDRRAALKGRRVRTIYVGGGTPSRLDPHQLAAIIDHIRCSDEVASGDLEEVTIEANPLDVTARRLAIWGEAGVERLSIGVQSFEPRVLARLGREHTGEQARDSIVRAIEAGMRVSFDLMLGAPEQTMAEWRRDLEVFAQIAQTHALDHLSAYNLTVEPKTPYARQQRDGALTVPGEDACAEMAQALAEVAQGVGFGNYEVSSWCVEGGDSRHNALYWSGAEYLGVGVGAHSLRIDERGVSRRRNTRHLSHYLRAPLAAEDAEILTAEQHFSERVFVAMRTRAGVDLTELRHQFKGAIPEAVWARLRERLDTLSARGLMREVAPGQWGPTDEGLMVADAVGGYLV